MPLSGSGTRPRHFGRIAAQTAKQVIFQRIREAERDLKYEEYAGREGDIVTGIIQQSDNRYTLLDLGKVEALLPQAEQVPFEHYEHNAGSRPTSSRSARPAKAPRSSSRAPPRPHSGSSNSRSRRSPTASSRSRPARVSRHRTKIAVWSNDPNVDPVGACVGARGRASAWSPPNCGGRRSTSCLTPMTPRVRDAGPAAREVKEVRLDEESRHGDRHRQRLPAVPGHRQGRSKSGLAARLTGWRIDIKSESQLAEEEAYAAQEWAEGEWVKESGEMVWQPAGGGEALSAPGMGGRFGLGGARRRAPAETAAPGWTTVAMLPVPPAERACPAPMGLSLPGPSPRRKGTRGRPRPRRWPGLRRTAQPGRRSPRKERVRRRRPRSDLHRMSC